MKITLIQPPVWGTYDPPLALAQLSACARSAGHEVLALDLNIELYLNRKEGYKDMWAWEQSLFWYDPARVPRFFEDNRDGVRKYVERIVSFAPRIICFSVSASSRLAGLELARILKAQCRDSVVVFGGTLFFENKWIDEVLRGNEVDIVAYGEGEQSLCEAAKLMEEGRSLEGCAGIAFKKDGKIVLNPPRPLLKNLDELPFLDFSDLPLSNYDDAGHIPFMTTRGCVQQCAFCSSRSFWPGYRQMSGERIFREIEAHKKRYPDVGHIDFLDLMFNGNIRSLHTFCDLMLGSEMKGEMSWVANAIIRPEMTLDLLRKMKASGCKHLIYGIESGSQRVLGLMRKRYRIEDADAVIKATHEAGIVVTTNFMFGFPGEEEEDFQQTLAFIRRNAPHLDRVYPSRTYCALEEFSYLHSHPEEFGVKPNPPNHLYWESLDGRNTYPERLRRCEEFCRVAEESGIEVASGVQTSVGFDRWFSLAQYYDCKKDAGNAVECYLKCFDLEENNRLVTEKILEYLEMVSAAASADTRALLPALKTAAGRISTQGQRQPPKELKRTGREKSIAMSRAEQRDNTELNEREFTGKKLVLHSSPRALFIQAAGPCNSSCVFCSRGKDYEQFDLETYRRLYEEKLTFPLDRTEQIIYTGSGEFLQLPAGKDVLDYFDGNFPHVAKMFSTNGSSLTPRICDAITGSRSRYTIHVSLHASHSGLHQVMTRMNNFHQILGQVKYLLETRKSPEKTAVHLIFVATTLNIEDLPNFVRVAAGLKADKVVCYYNYIYVPAQKYLSCFFKQELTNRMLDEAQGLAQRLKIQIDLPPKFGLKEYPLNRMCREPWSQFMFNLNGHVLPCDASEDCNENLAQARWFWNVWNGEYYQKLRKSLVEGTSNCYKYCFRANPGAVNDFRSHVIRRGRNESEISLLWGDNF